MNLQRRGFSLVLALAVMGLLVLVILSLSGLLAVESRVAAAGLAGRQARLNALVAGRLAVGQLQLLAGNDQRVTARADIFDKDAAGASRNTYYTPINSSGSQVDAERRWWTGVWMTGTGGTLLRSWDPALPDNRIFLGWLVSPEPTGSPVLQLTPSSSITKGDSDALASRILDDGATEGGARLLGPNDLGSTAPASEQVRRPSFPLPEGGGSIAWWTSDEGLKARINLADPLLEPAEGSPINFPAVNAWWKGFRLAAFGQSGADPASSTGRVPGLREARDADLRAAAARTPAQGAEGTDLVRTRTRADLQVWLNNRGASATAEKGVASGWHHLTGVSRGVMSNTLDGGLKVDLSVAFELPYDTVTTASGTTKGWKDITCFAPSPDRNILNLNTGVSESTEGVPSKEWNHNEPLRYVFEVPIPEAESRGRARTPFTVAGPTWDLLRSHYRLYKREIEPLVIPGVPWTVSANTWLARGSAPYTFQAGSPTQATTRPHPGGTPSLPTTPPALFGPKANLAALQPLAASGTAQPRHFRTLTLEDGSTATRIRELRARLAPQVTRVGMIHSLIYCQNTLAIGLDAFVALHNPYDVPLEFAGIGVTWAQFNNTRFNIYRADAPTVPIATCTLGNDTNTSTGATVQRSYNLRGFHTYPVGGAPAGRWNYVPATYLRIEPGETRILTPNLAGNRWQVYRNLAYQHMSMAAFAYDLQSNYRINAHRISDGAQIMENAPLLDSLVMPSSTGSGSEPLIAEMLVGDASQVNAFDIHLYRANRHATSSSAPGWWAWLGETSIPSASDHADEHHLQRVSFRANTAFAPTGTDGAVRGQPYPRSGAVDGTRNLPDKRFFAITELKLRSAAETNGFPIPLLALNPRAQLADPRNWDGQSATAPGWQASIKTLSGDPLTELQFWPGNVPEKNQASWGNSHFPGSGTRTTILFQVPRRPLLSIAQLTHADIGELDFDPAYAIGNSYAHMGLDELDKVLYWPPSPISGGTPLERLDLSFAANMGLWDRGFFSGLNGGTATSEDGTVNQPNATLQLAAERFVAGNTDAIANRRHRFWLSSTDAPTTALEATVVAAAAKRRDALLNPATTARQLLQEGTFNVNSTSVEAWKAQLTGGFGALANGLTKRPEHPFSRLQPPAGESVESGETNRWRTYRSLAEGSPALDLLAQAIVTEVRARGPFMCLADFVNRRLKADTNGRKGSLQAAIDAAGLNPDIVATAIGTTALERLPQAVALSPSGVPAEAPVALGRPDMILQSDILTAIGPHLSARSDTFVIRAYGEHKGASAWCEITVQRTPDWIVPQAEEATIPDPDYRTRIKRSKGELADMSQRNPAIKPANLALGRRFVITDFRWIPAP